MRYSLLFLLLSAVGWRLSAQISLNNSYFPQAGDTLRIAVDTTAAGITVSGPGGGQTWNFSTLSPAIIRVVPYKPAAEGQQAASFPAATLVAPGGVNGENYYRTTGTTFELIGFAGGAPIGFPLNVNTSFNPAVLERRAPLNFFDINQTTSALLVPFSASQLPPEILALLPFAPDSIRLRVASSRVDVVDGWGSLTIPGGTYNVLRERRTQYSDTRLDIKIGPLPWTDITALVPIPGAALGRDTSLTYHYFSNQAKEAIAVVTADHITQAVEAVQYKFNGILSAAKDFAPASAFRLYPNPASDFAVLAYDGLPQDNYQLRIYDITGKCLANTTFFAGENGQYATPTDILQPGTYLMMIFTGRGELFQMEKLIIAK
jgi:hypothetical protein